MWPCGRVVMWSGLHTIRYPPHPRDALSEWCSEGAIGGANEGTIDVAPGSLHQALGPIAGVLRAGGRHAITQAAIGLKVEDERRKSLAEKGWARRAVVVRGVGPCGGADLEQLPGREEYGRKREYNLKRFCVENIEKIIAPRSPA